MSATQLPERGGDWRHRFVEEMGGLVLVHGTPRGLMRVLAWMVVCEPPEQTAADIQKELTLSAGSVSTSLRMLGDIGMVERVARPGDRHIYYRLWDEGWEFVLERLSGPSTRSAGWQTGRWRRPTAPQDRG